MELPAHTLIELLASRTRTDGMLLDPLLNSSFPAIQCLAAMIRPTREHTRSCRFVTVRTRNSNSTTDGTDWLTYAAETVGKGLADPVDIAVRDLTHVQLDQHCETRPVRQSAHWSSFTPHGP